MSSTRAAAGVLPTLDIGASRAPVADGRHRRVLQAWHDDEGRLVASGGHDHGSWWMDWPGLGTYIFGREGSVTAYPAAAGLEDRLQDSFLRGVLPVVLLSRGFEAFHASAVADDRGVVMLCATSGTGKSTMALALDAEGLPQWADDTVVYHLPGDHPVALRLPFPVRVDDAARRAMSSPRDGAPAPEAESRPLTRIYHLVRDSGLDPRRPRCSPIPPAARFERLLAHAHPFDMGPESRRRDFIAALLSVARTADTWECRFAPSLDALPALARSVRQHIDQAAQ
jgi:hypothetical protein